MDSLVLDTAVGLILTFAALSAVVTVITESLARYLGLRSEYLLRGIRALLEKENDFRMWPRTLRSAVEKPSVLAESYTFKVVNSPFYRQTGSQGKVATEAGNDRLTRKQRRQLPSYLSGRAFAGAVLEILKDAAKAQAQAQAGQVPTPTPTPTPTPSLMEQIEKAAATLDEPLRTPVLTFLDESEKDIAVFRRKIEEWFDDEMARVSGWYKAHVRWISLGLAAVIVVVLNVNALQIADAFYTDQALRESVVTEAGRAADCGDKQPGQCLQDLRQQSLDAKASGLPIGWGGMKEKVMRGCAARSAADLANARNIKENGTACNPDAGQWALLIGLTLLGWLVMVLATLPGARFWFDLLARLGSLRESGPKPRSST